MAKKESAREEKASTAKRGKRLSQKLLSLTNDIGEGNSVHGIYRGEGEFTKRDGEILKTVKLNLLNPDTAKLEEEETSFWAQAGLTSALSSAGVKVGDKIEIEVGKTKPHKLEDGTDATVRQFAIYASEF